MKKNTIKGFVLLALALGAGFTANAQTPEERAEIVKNYDLEKIEALKISLREKFEKNYRRAVELAELNNWPLKKVENGSVGVLTGVNEYDEPIYKFIENEGAAITARVPAVRTGGALGLNLNGQGMTAGMWEIEYPRTNHIDLFGRVTIKDGGSFQESQKDHEDVIHATHVAGTIIGSGTGNDEAMGIAYQANLWSYDAIGDDSEALTAAGQGLLVSNHSYGRRVSSLSANEQWMRGAYSAESRDWDEVMYAAPYYQAVISAGNDRTGETNDLLVGNKTSKNAIVVAAVNNVANYNPNNPQASVQMSSFSSYGPADDTRIKPDISTKGVGVFSCSSKTASAYATLQGTSMAAPGITGCLLLMQQHYHNLNNVYMRAATLRGLMISTADEAGANPGPDHRFGWGLINTTRAVEVITGDHDNTTAIIEENTLNNNATYTKQVTASGNGPLKVTIAWTDPAGVASTGSITTNPALKNDLDVRVTKGSSTYYPWRLNPLLNQGAVKEDNTVDNVEVVEIANPAGVYTITVSHKGFLLNPSNQKYSLIINGVSDTAGISDNQLNNSISVYPNPAKDVINIALDSALTTDNCSVVMYDLQGRVVKQFNNFVDSINVSDLSASVYMLNIAKDGAVSSKKIIVE